MRTVWHYCIIAAPLVFAFSMLATITDSILTKAVPSSDTGKTHQKRSGWCFLSFESIGHFPAPTTAVEHWVPVGEHPDPGGRTMGVGRANERDWWG